MKARYHLRLAALLLAGLFALGQVHAQDSTSIRSLLEKKQWLFRAQTAHPMSGQMQQLTTNYDLAVRGDSLLVYLPYFGRSYVPMIGGEGGIKLNTRDFSYKIRNRKKGGYEVTLKPKANREWRELFLTISDNGYGTLQVMSNNRQPISFSGYIMK
jgi:hypothetical protein